MSDFDFDELDKAVTGAINDTPSEEPEEPSRSATPPAARRTSGRFMDIMHPSSDMRTRSNDTPGQPSHTSAIETPSSQSDDSQEVEEQEQEPEAPWVKPLESPFLPDAKVEKRPLGGHPPVSSQEQPDELLLEAPDEPLLEATAMPDPIDFAAAQQTAPLEKEEDTVPVEPEGSEPEMKGTPFALPLEDTPSLDDATVYEPTPADVDAPGVPSVTSEPEHIDETPAAPSSITQQYTEKPRDEQASGAIYDTETYHQPVAHQPKKHAGAWTILWISLLVIVGAGAGVAFYIYIMPML